MSTLIFYYLFFISLDKWLQIATIFAMKTKWIGGPIPLSLRQRVERAAYSEHMTLTAFLCRALVVLCDLLEDERGSRFPPRRRKVRPGRPRKISHCARATATRTAGDAYDTTSGDYRPAQGIGGSGGDHLVKGDCNED